MILEVACFSEQAVNIALQAGAQRIEWCRQWQEGGTSPDLSQWSQIQNPNHIPIFAMVRPRGGDFVYDARELENMIQTIHSAGECGVNGFVFGALTRSNEVDEEACHTLIQAASGLPCTFHRAFDLVSKPDESLLILNEMGFSRILTSGKPGKAIDEKEMLQRLSYISTQTKILPGGGVRSDQLETWLNLGFDELHSSCITQTNSEWPDPREIQQFQRFNRQ